MLSIVPNEYLFVAKYRPQKLEECILPEADRKLFEGIVKSGKVPNMILQSNMPGTGKTTIAHVLCNELDVERLFVNGADCTIDFVRNDLTRFAMSKSIEGKQKVVIIDEFDRKGLTAAQEHLRVFIENVSSNCAFVITANNLDGIIKPLQSRCPVTKFGNPNQSDKNAMMMAMCRRSIAICEAEGIVVEDKKVIAALVKKWFPDFRSTLSAIDSYSKMGKIDSGVLQLILPSHESIDDVVTAIRTKDFSKFPAIAAKHSSDYPTFIRQLFDGMLPKLSGMGKLSCTEIIGENNAFHGLAGNPELHVIRLLAKLMTGLVNDWVA